MSIPEVPGTTAPLAATTAPPPAVVPASNPVVGGGLPGSVAQTFSTNKEFKYCLPASRLKGVLWFRPPARVFG